MRRTAKKLKLRHRIRTEYAFTPSIYDILADTATVERFLDETATTQQELFDYLVRATPAQRSELIEWMKRNREVADGLAIDKGWL